MCPHNRKNKSFLEGSEQSSVSTRRDSSSSFSSVEEAFCPSEFPNTVQRILEARAISDQEDFTTYNGIDNFDGVQVIPDRFLPSLVLRLNRMSDSEMKHLNDRTVEAAMYFMRREKQRRHFMDIGYGKDIPVLRFSYEQLPDHLIGPLTQQHVRTEQSTALSRSESNTSIQSNSSYNSDSNVVLQPGSSGSNDSSLPHSSSQLNSSHCSGSNSLSQPNNFNSNIVLKPRISGSNNSSLPDSSSEPSSSERSGSNIFSQPDSSGSSIALQSNISSRSNSFDSNSSSQLGSSQCSKAKSPSQLSGMRSNNTRQTRERSLQPSSKEARRLTNVKQQAKDVSFSGVRRSTIRHCFNFRFRNRFGMCIDLDPF